MRIRISLKVKTLILIFLITILLVGVAVVSSYTIHKSTVDSYYVELVSSIGKSEASIVDTRAVSQFLELVTSEEYQKIHEKAIYHNDEQLLIDHLTDKGLYDTYLEVNEQLSSFCATMNVDDIYLESVQGSFSISLFDPQEDIFNLGIMMKTPDEFEEYTTNDAIPATVSHTRYGWLCSGYESVSDADGNKIALVGVDIDMNDIVAQRQAYVRNLIIYMVVFVFAGAFLAVFIMNKTVVKPLDMLTSAAGDFVSSSEYSLNNIVDIPIHTGDEIEELYGSIRKMETDIIEYIRNLTKVTAEKERIGAELNVAAQIQADMLPCIFPAFPERDEFDIYASMSPAKEVGGDFYDFFLVDDDHLALVMADVSGKGVPAALFMVIAKTLIKNRTQMGGTPAQILSYVNDQLCEGNEAELFVTVWLAVVELSTGKGISANAGHEHPVIKHKDGKYEYAVYRHSPALAAMEGTRFREREFELKPGDCIYVYTDGVPEATDANDELFGQERLLDALNSFPDAAPEQVLKNVKVRIDNFVKDAPQFDDITMLCMQYVGKGDEK